MGRGDAVEDDLRARWHGIAGPGAGDDLLSARGGTASIVALVVELQRARIPVTMRDLLKFPTVPALARALRGRAPGGPGEYPDFAEVWGETVSPWSAPASSLVRLAAGTGTPMFFVHNGLGYIRAVERAVEHFRCGRPVYGFEAIGLRDRRRPPLSIPEFAERYVTELRTVQPHGPYWIGGVCMGSHVAFEMAHRLADAGEEVALLAVLNSVRPGHRQVPAGWGLSDFYLERLAHVQLMFGDLELTPNLATVIETLAQRFWLDGVRPEDFYWHAAVNAAAMFAHEHYDPRPYPGPALVFQPTRTTSGEAADWRPVAPRARTLVFDAADSLTIMATSEFVDLVAPRAPDQNANPPA